MFGGVFRGVMFKKQILAEKRYSRGICSDGQCSTMSGKEKLGRGGHERGARVRSVGSDCLVQEVEELVF